MAVLLWRALELEPREPRVTLLAAVTLALFNVALPMVLPEGWLVALWACEVGVLVTVFTRVRHPVLLPWATGLAVVVFVRLAFGSDLYASGPTPSGPPTWPSTSSAGWRCSPRRT